jgi:hypothetical protein
MMRTATRRIALRSIHHSGEGGTLW